MTSGDERATRRAGGAGIDDLGEAIAPASKPGRTGGGFGAGAAPIGALAAMIGMLGGLSGLGCGDEARPRAAPAEIRRADRTAADPARDIATELDSAAPAFGAGILAELTGDERAAREAFEHVLAAPDTPPPIAARAALHLAQLESRSGKLRHSLDLVARAAALAPTDPVITDGLAQLRADFVAAAGAGDIRGPRLGTPLPGVPPEVAEAFAVAERALAMVQRMRPRPIIEALSTSIRAKEDASESAVAKYRAVGEHGGLARIAAHYRAGSLYHDLAIGLLFDLPPELDPAVAAGLRRHLRGRAVSYLRKAVAEYRACLAVPQVPDAELWRLAAETDLRRALDVLGEP